MLHPVLGKAGTSGIEHFLQLFVGTAEKYAACISAIEMRMVGKVAQHTVRFSTTARAAIKDFKNRTA